MTAAHPVCALIDTLTNEQMQTGEALQPAAAVDHARAIATAAHEGQVDKAGRPYIAHPARVARRVAGDDAAVAVAWLHDVVEDTPVTLESLAHLFSATIVEAVDAITRRERELPADYYQRVQQNPLAVTVKLADLADNSDPGRLAALDEKTRSRLTRKYARAREVLEGSPSTGCQ